MHHMSDMTSGTGDHITERYKSILSCQESPMQHASPQISCERATLFEGSSGGKDPIPPLLGLIETQS